MYDTIFIFWKLYKDIKNSITRCLSFQKLDIAVQIDYAGGFQLTLDVDVIFGAWAYLFIKVSKLSGLARLQLTRVPFTHWSFSFYEVRVYWSYHIVYCLHKFACLKASAVLLFCGSSLVERYIH